MMTIPDSWLQPHACGPLPRVTVVVLSVLLLVTTQGCKAKHSANAAELQTDPNQVAITPVIAENLKFGTPEMMSIDGTLQVAAHVETDARRIARVGSPVSGRIVNLLVFEGQQVKAGTVLAMLHSTDLSDTQLALIKAASQRGLAEASEKRAEQLLAAEVIGQAELERRRAELLQANTQPESCRTQLRGLGMTEAQIRQLETSHKLSADYPIVSPRSGTVLKREITVGQVVQPADPAFTIADLSTVWIVANVPEEDAGQLQKGYASTGARTRPPTAADNRASLLHLTHCRPGHTHGRGPHGCPQSGRPAQAGRTRRHDS